MEQLPITPLDRVAAYQPLWSGYHHRYNRSEGLDAKLAGEWRVVNGRMNELLDNLFAQTVVPLAEHEPYVKPIANFGLGKATLYEDVEVLDGQGTE